MVPFHPARHEIHLLVDRTIWRESVSWNRTSLPVGILALPARHRRCMIGVTSSDSPAVGPATEFRTRSFERCLPPSVRSRHFQHGHRATCGGPLRSSYSWNLPSSPEAEVWSQFQNQSEDYRREEDPGNRIRFVAVLAATLQAEQVTLKNGDRLSGAIVSMDGKKLVIKTTYAGEVSIDWAEVSEFSSAKDPLVVTKADKQVVSGPVMTEGPTCWSPPPRGRKPSPHRRDDHALACRPGSLRKVIASRPHGRVGCGQLRIRSRTGQQPNHKRGARLRRSA